VLSITYCKDELLDYFEIATLLPTDAMPHDLTQILPCENSVELSEQAILLQK
jgi:hypothetical protein